MATAIGVTAGAVIITDGVAAEGIITAGGTTTFTKIPFCNSEEVATAGGLFFPASTIPRCAA
jgi:hypothetical protein